MPKSSSMRYWKSLALISFVLSSIQLLGQDLSASQLLDKAIQYHDPSGNWPSFQGEMTEVMNTPDDSDRVTRIKIDLPNQYFEAAATKDEEVITHIVDKGECKISPADAERIATLEEPPKRSHCDLSTLYKDYYTYLYGLPMKLKDPGTILDPVVLKKTFKGKEYLVLKVTYDEAVGSDVWFFYFDPSTYAMEVYQFYKGDPEGVGKDTGEYILLSGMETKNGIKMPKTRAWYYNKDDGYLGTDTLEK